MIIASRTAAVLATAVCLAAVSATADVTIVDEDFESYTSLSELNDVWPNTNTPNGRLVDETFMERIIAPVPPDDVDPQDIGSVAFPEEGQGFEHQGDGYVEIDLLTLTGGQPVLPTPTQSVVLEGDIYDVGGIGNKRMTIGLRSNAPENIVELGLWNVEDTNYGYRAALFPTTPDAPNPDWGFFELPAGLDRPDDADDLVTPGDIGADWHTYRAIITPDTLTYEIDLSRNGVNNETDEPGPDASITFDLSIGDNGFDSLRLGGPSGVTSPGNDTYGGVIFDNVRLTLVDAAAPAAGDFNADGRVDNGDLNLLLGAWGDATVPSEWVNGFVTPVDNGELNALLGDWGLGIGSAVPEPASLGLVLTGLLVGGRRR